MMRLTEEQKKFWSKNGYLAVEGVIPLDLIESEKERFEWLCENWDSPAAQAMRPTHESGLSPEDWNAKTSRGFADLALHDDAFRAHALHPTLLDIVEDLIGSPIALYETQALLKPPSIGSPKPPHQDNAYFRVIPDDAVITCWGALDDATVENGCMQYIPGSHRLGHIKHKWIEGTPHQVPEGVDLNKAVSVPLKAGGVIFHHSLTLHMSGPNNSQQWRRPLICHYAREDADFTNSVVSPQKFLHARS
jgi:phytanoyl-CoA hydroxylase